MCIFQDQLNILLLQIPQQRISNRKVKLSNSQLKLKKLSILNQKDKQILGLKKEIRNLNRVTTQNLINLNQNNYNKSSKLLQNNCMREYTKDNYMNDLLKQQQELSNTFDQANLCKEFDQLRQDFKSSSTISSTTQFLKDQLMQIKGDLKKQKKSTNNSNSSQSHSQSPLNANRYQQNLQNSTNLSDQFLESKHRKNENTFTENQLGSFVSTSASANTSTNISNNNQSKSRSKSDIPQNKNSFLQIPSQTLKFVTTYQHVSNGNNLSSQLNHHSFPNSEIINSSQINQQKRVLNTPSQRNERNGSLSKCEKNLSLDNQQLSYRLKINHLPPWAQSSTNSQYQTQQRNIYSEIQIQRFRKFENQTNPVNRLLQINNDQITHCNQSCLKQQETIIDHKEKLQEQKSISEDQRIQSIKLNNNKQNIYTNMQSSSSHQEFREQLHKENQSKVDQFTNQQMILSNINSKKKEIHENSKVDSSLNIYNPYKIDVSNKMKDTPQINTCNSPNQQQFKFDHARKYQINKYQVKNSQFNTKESGQVNKDISKPINYHQALDIQTTSFHNQSLNTYLQDYKYNQINSQQRKFMQTAIAAHVNWKDQTISQQQQSNVPITDESMQKQEKILSMISSQKNQIFQNDSAYSMTVGCDISSQNGISFKCGQKQRNITDLFSNSLHSQSSELQNINKVNAQCNSNNNSKNQSESINQLECSSDVDTQLEDMRILNEQIREVLYPDFQNKSDEHQQISNNITKTNQNIPVNTQKSLSVNQSCKDALNIQNQSVSLISLSDQKNIEYSINNEAICKQVFMKSFENKMEGNNELNTKKYLLKSMDSSTKLDSFIEEAKMQLQSIKQMSCLCSKRLRPPKNKDFILNEKNKILPPNTAHQQHKILCQPSKQTQVNNSTAQKIHTTQISILKN